MPTGRNQCLLFAAAMVLNVSTVTIIEEIGHDGTEIWWPKLMAPRNERSIHIDEIQDFAFNRGFAFAPISRNPQSWQGRGTVIRDVFSSEDTRESRFRHILVGKDAIIFGQMAFLKHAVAWNGEKIYDPNGRIYPLENFKAEEAYILAKL